MAKPLTTEEFHQKIRENFGDQYDLSGVVWPGANKKVTLTCRDHGTFTQTSHLLTKKDRPSGCQLCGKARTADAKRKGTGFIIEKFRAVHGDRFDYSTVVWKGIDEKVTIICREHGDFSVRPYKHLGPTGGCQQCNRIRREQTARTFEDWVSLCKAVHGDQYEYIRLTKRDGRAALVLRCPEHGEFVQAAKTHLQGRGCSKCGGIKIAESKRMSVDDYVERARTIHGDLYDYSEVEFDNIRQKIKIGCPDHGFFLQYAEAHTRLAIGCPKCKASKPEVRIRLWLENQDLDFVEQWRDHDCRFESGRLASFDFYLPQHNLIIEYDGEFHFMETVTIYPSRKMLEPNIEANQKRDRIKDAWATTNGIRLERIRYDEDLENCLDSILFVD